MLDARALDSDVITIMSKKLSYLPCIRIANVSYLDRQNQLPQMS